jgi:hypothetical protein
VAGETESMIDRLVWLGRPAARSGQSHDENCQQLNYYFAKHMRESPGKKRVPPKWHPLH